jgi:hypothetical protein
LESHEQTHFRSDFAITNLELSSNQGLYVAAYKKVHKSSPPWSLLEEGIANSYARSALPRSTSALDQFLDSSPIGYRDWRNFNSRNRREDWKAVLSDILRGTSPGINVEFSAMIAQSVSQKYLRQIPVYLVDDIYSQGLTSGSFLGPISIVSETETFLEDIKRLSKGQPRYAKKWNQTKVKMAQGNLSGIHLEKIDKKRNIHTVRIDDDVRAALQIQGEWNAIAADRHDALYRRINNL